MSSTPKPFRTGRIVMGLNAQGNDPLAPLHDSARFTQEMEEEYTLRVKSRARAAAKDIIAKAMAEAEAIKQQAHEQGYEQGMATAHEELASHSRKLSDKFNGFLHELHAYKDTVRAEYCRDMSLLLKTALEKIVSMEIATDRVPILDHLLNEALTLIDNRERITLFCAPEDESLLNDLVAQSVATFPDLQQWIVKASPEIRQGGLKIESSNGMVDNTIDARFALVREIVDQISLEDEQ
ncbi:FliH/SctL family protein [Desulfoplanes formicivorans]|uniref:Flagellar assembly protein FliH n=1 Tax=Desulfoplanes formicivorans TaxID=1592317 RepID=A0A194AJ71_9BACT|nr:FliH/SctL family protein [Desulfoplanes formicivorans]GAU08794.1 flagellar assembly protein FliH [Desulfoplanes formicivorans]